MSPDLGSTQDLRAAWGAPLPHLGDADYSLLRKAGDGYAALSRDGSPALVLPLDEVGGTAAGRVAAGCELVGHRSTRLAYDGQSRTVPAAALVCNDPRLLDAFAVLAADVAERVRSEKRTWSNLLVVVEEWLTLLAPRDQLSAEAELGLWGELWFLADADDIDRALKGWRGPEGDATDFFVAGRSAEVKTSRLRRQHHVSLTQVRDPVGAMDAWIVSVWVKEDPGVSWTVARLAESILERASDRGDALRRLLRAGYAPAERSGYTRAFAVLSEPEWYAATDVPRVRAIDPGVSHVRYRVTLAAERRANDLRSASLWRHFHGHDHAGARR